MPDEASIKAIVGHQFPGGEYLIAHWENFLLTECTGADLLPDGMVHPVALFHVPILGAGTSIHDMFEVGQADSEFSIGIESYEWDMFRPLQEDVNYQISGQVVSAERKTNEQGGVYDRIQFVFDVRNEGKDVARSTITWHYNRRDS